MKTSSCNGMSNRRSLEKAGTALHILSPLSLTEKETKTTITPKRPYSPLHFQLVSKEPEGFLAFYSRELIFCTPTVLLALTRNHHTPSQEQRRSAVALLRFTSAFRVLNISTSPFQQIDGSNTNGQNHNRLPFQRAQI